MSIADHDIISQRYFFPTRQSLPDACMVDVGEAELACFAADHGHDLTLVHFHGNGEIVGKYVPWFTDMVDDLGANTFLAEYRGYGGSTGTPRLGAMLDDVSPIHDTIEHEIGVPDEQMVVFGRSIGSIYAIEFAARFPNIAGLVLESGIADVLERILLRATPGELGTSPEAMREEFGRLFDHEQKLRDYPGKTLVLHAKGDSLVDRTHAERNARWAGEEGGDVKLVLFDRGDHNTIFGANEREYVRELGEFLDRAQSAASTT